MCLPKYSVVSSTVIPLGVELMKIFDNITSVILAGGKSSRMGREKALLPLGDATFIEHILDIAARVTQEAFVITNTPDKMSHLNVSMYPDIFPDTGPLGGIYTGLFRANTEYCLLLACDAPFITPEFLSYLCGRTGDSDVIIPEDDKGFHPLCAVYSKRCLEPIKEQIEAEDLKIVRFFNKVKVDIVGSEAIDPFDLHGNLLSNINTPEDYRNALNFFQCNA